MLGKLKRVVDIVDTANTEHAMTLNYGVGKTAAIASFRGRGSKRLREEHYTSAAPHLDVLVKHGVRHVPITHAYKHMGGQVTASGTPTPEVDARAAASISAMGVIRAGVLAQPRIPQQQRVSLYDSLAVSKLLFNAQVWGALTNQHLARLQSAYMRGFRVIAGTPATGSHSTLGTTDAVVMAGLG
eukprot:11279370-Alexandrium_andersonii.AAC.1